jgi:hypothetical protein
LSDLDGAAGRARRRTAAPPPPGGWNTSLKAGKASYDLRKRRRGARQGCSEEGEGRARYRDVVGLLLDCRENFFYTAQGSNCETTRLLRSGDGGLGGKRWECCFNQLCPFASMTSSGGGERGRAGPAAGSRFAGRTAKDLLWGRGKQIRRRRGVVVVGKFTVRIIGAPTAGEQYLTGEACARHVDCEKCEPTSIWCSFLHREHAGPHPNILAVTRS